MWAGGIANPLTVIEQLTYLLFIKRLDELHTLRERKAARTKKPIEDPIFRDGKNPTSRANPKRPYADFRWSRFRDFAPETVFEIVRDEVFPFLKTLGKGTAEDGSDSTYAHHMKDALFMFPSPRLLANVIDQLDSIDMADRDTKGDLYEYMLGKIASAGQKGQFRTPRHIIKLMVEMIAPKPQDTICDPACGTCGFMVASAEHLRDHHEAEIFADAKSRRRFNEQTFHGYDFDSTMLRIGSMNMLLHGVENPDIRYKDSLEESHGGDAEAYTVILANPPFAGSLDYESTAKDLLQIVKTKKTELLFLALFLRLLKTGGRAAVIVPGRGSLRLVQGPQGTPPHGTDKVWFYDMKADGFSLDDKRTPQEKSDLSDILARWKKPVAEKSRKRTDQSFLVPKSEIAAQGYDLSLNRYKEVEHEVIHHDSPKEIFANLTKLKAEIQKGMKELEGLLK